MRATRSGRYRTLWLLAALCGAPSVAAAQTGQPFSAQLSLLGAHPFGGGFSEVGLGWGWEAQGRWTPSLLSIGAGLEQSFHLVRDLPERELTLSGLFIEPRYVMATDDDRFAPYVSARLALSFVSADLGAVDDVALGYTLNGGGGVLVAASGRVNLDLGLTFGYKSLGSIHFPSIGPQPLGTGGNVITRVGVAIGLF